MPVIILILALLAIGVSGYLFCRYRAVASAGGTTRTLHSLPG
ncbi:MAG: phosphate ABC transporter permease family protein, partial [Gemmobacter sp.]